MISGVIYSHGGKGEVCLKIRKYSILSFLIIKIIIKCLKNKKEKYYFPLITILSKTWHNSVIKVLTCVKTLITS